VAWFQAYNQNLTTFMKSVGENAGLDLTQYTKPPKALYIEVVFQHLGFVNFQN